MTLYVDKTNRPYRVSPTTTWAFADYDIPGPLTARMLALQAVADKLAAAVAALSNDGGGRTGNAAAQKIVEDVWQEIEGILRPLVGASAEAKPQQKATEVVTSAPLPEGYVKKGSSSPTSSPRSRSSSRRDAATSAPPAKSEQ